MWHQLVTIGLWLLTSSSFGETGSDVVVGEVGSAQRLAGVVGQQARALDLGGLRLRVPGVGGCSSLDGSEWSRRVVTVVRGQRGSKIIHLRHPLALWAWVDGTQVHRLPVQRPWSPPGRIPHLPAACGTSW
jgi:hypothetical protein